MQSKGRAFRGFPRFSFSAGKDNVRVHAGALVVPVQRPRDRPALGLLRNNGGGNLVLLCT